MQIVNTGNFRKAFQNLLHRLYIQIPGRGVHQDGCGLFQKRPAVLQNKQHDQYLKQRVQPVPGFIHQYPAIDHHRNRGEHISYHVQKRAADVQAALGVLVQQPR